MLNQAISSSNNLNLSNQEDPRVYTKAFMEILNPEDSKGIKVFKKGDSYVAEGRFEFKKSDKDVIVTRSEALAKDDQEYIILERERGSVYEQIYGYFKQLGLTCDRLIISEIDASCITHENLPELCCNEIYIESCKIYMTKEQLKDPTETMREHFGEKCGSVQVVEVAM